MLTDFGVLVIVNVVFNIICLLSTELNSCPNISLVITSTPIGKFWHNESSKRVFYLTISVLQVACIALIFIYRKYGIQRPLDEMYFFLLIIASAFILVLTQQLIIKYDEVREWQEFVIHSYEKHTSLDIYNYVKSSSSILFLSTWMVVGTGIISYYTGQDNWIVLLGTSAFFLFVTGVAGNISWLLLCLIRSTLAIRKTEFTSKLFIHPEQIKMLGGFGNQVVLVFVVYYSLCLIPLPFTTFGQKLGFWHLLFDIVVILLIIFWFFTAIFAPARSIRALKKNTLEMATDAALKDYAISTSHRRSEWDLVKQSVNVNKELEPLRNLLKSTPTTAANLGNVFQFISALLIPIITLLIELLGN